MQYSTILRAGLKTTVGMCTFVCTNDHFFLKSDRTVGPIPTHLGSGSGRKKGVKKGPPKFYGSSPTSVVPEGKLNVSPIALITW
jgi:hypothetical protein